MAGEPLPLLLALPEWLDPRQQLLFCRRRGVGLENPGVGLDDLAQRPEGGPLAVGKRPALPPGDDLLVRVGDLEQFGHQPALSDPRDADESHELRGLLPARVLECVCEQASLALAPHQRRAQLLLDVASEAGPGADCLPHLDRFRLPLRLDRLRLAVIDDVARRAVRPLADEDAVDRRRALQPRGGVDDVAGHHCVALAGLRSERDERLTGVDGGADLEFLPARVADGERRTHGALGVVLVRDRRAEDGHHRIPDELLDGAPEALELGTKLRVVSRERRADVLGVEPLRARGRADEVGEEDRHDLPLLARRSGRRDERRAAHAAEARTVEILVAAGRTGDHVRTVDLSLGAGLATLGEWSPWTSSGPRRAPGSSGTSPRRRRRRRRAGPRSRVAATSSSR